MTIIMSDTEGSGCCRKEMSATRLVYLFEFFDLFFPDTKLSLSEREQHILQVYSVLLPKKKL